MTIHKIRLRRERFATCLVKSALLAMALLAGAAANAFAAGSISGRVTGDDAPGGLANIGVQLYDLNGDSDVPASTTTDGSGNYTFSNLPNSTYAVLTQAKQGYINEIWDNDSCSAVCNTETGITPIVVNNNSTTGINFVLVHGGGRIAGTVTDASTGLPIAGVTLLFGDGSGNVAFTSATTDSSGNYLSDGGSVTGSVYVFTKNSLGYINEAYDDCKVDDCEDLVSVTLGATTNGINFALDKGGRISGHVEDSSHSPLANVIIHLSDSTGQRFDDEELLTDASGNFISPGLLAGTYYVNTQNQNGLVDLLWNNTVCAGGFCNPVNGTPITVTGTATTSGINFVLPAGGTISGTVTRAAGGAAISNASVSINDASGAFVGGANTNSSGAYTIPGVPTGTYTVQAFATNFVGQIYNNLSCATCSLVNVGTKVVVVENTAVNNINFAMLATGTGTITGTVTQGGVGTSGIQVILLGPNNNQVTTVNTIAGGTYTFSNVATGSYYVRTNTFGGFINQLYPGVTCLACNVTTTPGGTVLTLTSGGTLSNINFALATGGRISGNIFSAVGGVVGGNVSVQVFNSSGTSVGSLTSSFNSGAGTNTYTTFGLPAGTYYVKAGSGMLVNQLYSGVSCPQTSCVVTTGTPVNVVGTATTPNINFTLGLGGLISGTLTNAANSTPLPFTNVQLFDSAGILIGTVATNNSGIYTSSGLPAGNYFARTAAALVFQNNTTAAFLDELYNDQSCVPACQNPALGTPIAVTTSNTTTANFALTQAGWITGAITDAGAPGVGLGSILVAVYTSSGALAKTTATNSFGGYTATGLPAGTYFARTSVPGTQFYGDELYQELPCGAGCTPTSGTPISVVGVSPTNSVNFTLAAGTGGFSGTVTDAVTSAAVGLAQVQVYAADGTLVKTVGGGSGVVLLAGGLAPGTYYARTITTGNYLDELYSEIPCSPSCTVTSGTPITVTSGATTTGVNFTLTVGGGSLSGTMTNFNGSVAVGGESVQVYTSGGALAKSTTTNSLGAYSISGLPAGTYYARTALSAGALALYVDQLFDRLPCTATCNVTAGTAIVVTDGGTRTGVDFKLASKPITLSPTTLNFSGTNNAGTLNPITGPQSVTVILPPGTTAWAAAADQTWVQITGGSGTSSGTFTVGIVNPGNVLGSATDISATVTVSPTPASSTPQTVIVHLTLSPTHTSPFGSFDTPTEAQAIQGSIAVTGWALDDTEIDRVEIWRDVTTGETTPPFNAPGHPANGKIFIANPLFVSGARPDVAAAYATYPNANRAGWGYLLLTWGLWNQGNGSFTLYAFAVDKQGNYALLGSKHVTSNNAQATRPFGGVDVPAYGDTKSAPFFNFGWALTPNPNTTDPRSCQIIDGNVFVGLDSGPLVPVSYGDARPDIAGAFPGFSNGSNGGGHALIDTTTMSNGTHQIGWYVVDNCGRADGIGSRFFNVLNSSLTAEPSSSALAGVKAAATAAPASDPILLRRSERDWESVEASAGGTHVVELTEMERIELQLPAGSYAGGQLVNGVAGPLPVGSSLSADGRTFYWQPGAGFLGGFDLVFAPTSGAGLPVQVRAVVGPALRLAIDAPGAGSVAAQPFLVAGWALDLASREEGSGIDTVHVWAYPTTGAPPIFLGVANVGDARPDVAATYGARFERSSYGLVASGLPSGAYDLVVYAHRVATNSFDGAQTVSVTVP